jgi:hypothetical protein
MRLLMKKKDFGISTTRLPPLDKAERLIVGYTTTDHLILDLDKSRSLNMTVKIVKMIQREYPDVGDCLISQSSYDGFHCIFDNRLSWDRILHICKTLMVLGILNRNFIAVRKFREDLTLRITSIDRGLEKSEAPIPVGIVQPNQKPAIVQKGAWNFILGNFDGISEYLTVLSAYRNVSVLQCQRF